MKQPEPSDVHYVAALEELLRKCPEKAILARALQDALGEPEATRAFYIRYRSRQLADDEVLTQQVAERERIRKEVNAGNDELSIKSKFYKKYPVLSQVNDQTRKKLLDKYLKGEDISKEVAKLNRKEKMLTTILIVIVASLVLFVIVSSIKTEG